MIGGLMRGAHALDAWLKEHVGRPYTLILSVGLVLLMVQSVQELVKTVSEAGKTLTGDVVGFAFTVVFQLALLINVMAQWHEHRATYGRRDRDERQG